MTALLTYRGLKGSGGEPMKNTKKGPRRMGIHGKTQAPLSKGPIRN